MKRVRLEDIVRAAGVSVSTVSRALRGDEQVSVRTRRIVEIEARRLGYPFLPDSDGHNGEAAEVVRPIPGLKRLSTVLRETLQKHFFAETLLELIEQGRQRDFEVDYEVRTDSLADCLASTDADAVVFILWEKVSLKDAEALQKHAKPVLVVNRHIHGMVNSLTLDDYAAGVQSVRYLWNLGHRRIAYIPGKQSASSFVERASGFREALNEYGIYDPALFARLDDEAIYEAVREAVRQFMGSPHPPTAIAAYNDLTAWLALMTVGELGYQVPEDVSILGFDYAPEFRSYGITTWDYRRKDLGRYVVHLLDGLCRGDIEGPFRMAVMPTLIQGTTVGPVSGIRNRQ